MQGRCSAVVLVSAASCPLPASSLNSEARRVMAHLSVIDLTSPEGKESEPPAVQRFRANSESKKPPIIEKQRPVLNNRNTDTRFDLTKKRKAPTATITAPPRVKKDKPKKGQTSRGGKKQCDLGSKCPYKEEYQHQLEFDHDEEQSISTAVTFSGRGNKLGGSSSVHFGPKGQILGGSNSYSGNRGSSSSSSSRSGSSNIDRQGKKNGSSVSLTHLQDYHPLLAAADHEVEYVECTLCSSMVELFNYDKHLQAHEDSNKSWLPNDDSTSGVYMSPNDHYQHFSSRKTPNYSHQPLKPTPKPHASADLMKQQDEEFEKAEINDMLRLHHQQEQDEQDKNASVLMSHPSESEYSITKKGAISDSEVIDIQDDDDCNDDGYNDTNNIPKRIASGPKISLAFRFKLSLAPSAGAPSRPLKVVESFHVDGLLQDVFTFLDGTEVLAGAKKKWELRTSFGNRTFCRQTDAKRTLEELEIAANTLFVVQEV